MLPISVIIIPFLTMVYYVLTLSISPKESGIFCRIGLVAQQGNIQHCMFPRDYAAPYVP